jgi:hypothetical protein
MVRAGRAWIKGNIGMRVIKYFYEGNFRIIIVFRKFNATDIRAREWKFVARSMKFVHKTFARHIRHSQYTQDIC